LSGRGLCDELVTRPEESYRLCCVVVCDLETSRIYIYIYIYIYDISNLRVNIIMLSNSLLKHKVDNVYCSCVADRKRSVFWELISQMFNLSKTKRNLLYISNQSVPRCKHFPPRL